MLALQGHTPRRDPHDSIKIFCWCFVCLSCSCSRPQPPRAKMTTWLQATEPFSSVFDLCWVQPLFALEIVSYLVGALRPVNHKGLCQCWGSLSLRNTQLKGPVMQKNNNNKKTGRPKWESGELLGKIYGMKYSWKGRKDRNRHQSRIKRSGQKRQHPHHEKVRPWGQNKVAAWWQLKKNYLRIWKILAQPSPVAPKCTIVPTNELCWDILRSIPGLCWHLLGHIRVRVWYCSDWIVQPCRSWLSKFPTGEIPLGQYSCKCSFFFFLTNRHVCDSKPGNPGLTSSSRNIFT